MTSDRIQFYVGINTKDYVLFESLTSKMNHENSESKFNVDLVNKYEDPYGYEIYVLTGTWDAYRCFINEPFVKSLEHFED